MSREIYSSVPEEHLKPAQGSKEAVREFLESRPGKVFNAPTIARECGFPTRSTQVQVRKAITGLIEFDHLPIIAVQKGFLWATKSGPIFNYAENLGLRRQGLMRRIQAVLLVATAMKDIEDLK